MLTFEICILTFVSFSWQGLKIVRMVWIELILQKCFSYNFGWTALLDTRKSLFNFPCITGPTKPTQLPPELPPNTHGDQQQQAQLPKHSAKPLLLPPPRADTGLPPGSLGPLGSHTMPMDKSPSSRSYKGHTTSASSHHPKLPPLRQDSQTLFYAPDYSRKSSAPPFLPPSTAR